MATFSVTHTYVAGTLAKASEVNTNFGNVTTFLNAGGGGVNNAGIQQDNMGLLTGPLIWNLSTNTKAIDITSASNIVGIRLLQNAVLSSSNSALGVRSDANQTTGDALVHFLQTNSSSTIPTLRVDQSGPGTNIDLHDDAGLFFRTGKASGGNGSGVHFNVPTSGMVYEFRVAGTEILQLSSTGIDTANIIKTVNITNANVTRAKLEAVGQQQVSTFTFTTTSSSYVDVTGASLTITCSGRPLIIIVDGSYRMVSTATGLTNPSLEGNIKLVRDVTDLNEYEYKDESTTATQVSARDVITPLGIIYFDTPGAGTFTYKLQMHINGTMSGSTSLINTRFTVYEL